MVLLGSSDRCELRVQPSLFATMFDIMMLSGAIGMQAALKEAKVLRPRGGQYVYTSMRPEVSEELASGGVRGVLGNSCKQFLGMKRSRKTF